MAVFKRLVGAFLVGGCAAFVIGRLLVCGMPQPIVMFVVLLLILFSIGASCGNLYYGRHLDKAPTPPITPGDV
jgi:hypothetical protein